MACKLTLICPSYCRHFYLERSCRFWGNRDDVYVLYADGSQSPLDSPSISASNLRYFHQPFGLRQRLLGLLDQVQTPYVCMLGDDEFYIPSALQLCLDFLERHPDYVACMGRAIGVSRLEDNFALDSVYPRLRGRDLACNASSNRLKTHFSSYVPAHVYAVTRTDVFRSAMQAALSIELDLFAIYELVEEFLVVAAGKSMVLPVLYWLRSREAPPLRNTGDFWLDPSKGFDHWWRSREAEAEKKDFCNHLSMASCGAVNEGEIVQVLDCYIESLRKRDGIFVNQFVNPAAQSKAALREMRDQGVLIDVLGLAECLGSIKESWSR